MTVIPNLPAPALRTTLTTVDAPVDPAVRDRLDDAGLPALLAEITEADWQRVAALVVDPMAAESRAGYTAWLRRQATAWGAVRLPAVHVSALDWPLSSVRPQCLDVVGLIVADLRELSPRTRPAVVPQQPQGFDPTPHGTVVAAALLCLRVARRSAPLLGPAVALSAGMTALGTATRYVARCADLAERAAGLEHEITQWGRHADGAALAEAVDASQRFTARLADGLEAATRTGW